MKSKKNIWISRLMKYVSFLPFKFWTSDKERQILFQAMRKAIKRYEEEAQILEDDNLELSIHHEELRTKIGEISHKIKQFNKEQKEIDNARILPRAKFIRLNQYNHQRSANEI